MCKKGARRADPERTNKGGQISGQYGKLSILWLTENKYGKDMKSYPGSSRHTEEKCVTEEETNPIVPMER